MKDCKPCPFCGSDSVRLHYNWSRNHRFYYFVACDVCGSRTRGEAIPEDDVQEGTESEWENVAVKKSVACWNQRVVNVDA